MEDLELNRGLDGDREDSDRGNLSVTMGHRIGGVASWPHFMVALGAPRPSPGGPRSPWSSECHEL